MMLRDIADKAIDFFMLGSIIISFTVIVYLFFLLLGGHEDDETRLDNYIKNNACVKTDETRKVSEPIGHFVGKVYIVQNYVIQESKWNCKDTSFWSDR